MISQPRRNERAKQILGILKKHGPLPSSAIVRLLPSPMKPRKFEMALARLKKSNLVHVRRERTSQTRYFYYEVPQQRPHIERAASLLGCDLDQLIQPFFRYREIAHNELCAHLHHYLENEYPDALILRDFQLLTSKTADALLLSGRDDRDLKPDLILHFPKNDNFSATTIVFEIEKTRKDSSRLRHKMIKYSAKSKVDGVVFMCEDKTIISAIQSSYESHALKAALRISHYGSNFLLLAPFQKIPIDTLRHVYNFSGQNISVDMWIRLLRKSDRTERSDKMFVQGAANRPNSFN